MRMAGATLATEMTSIAPSAPSPIFSAATNDSPEPAPQVISFQDWQVRLQQMQQIITEVANGCSNNNQGRHNLAKDHLHPILATAIQSNTSHSHHYTYSHSSSSSSSSSFSSAASDTSSTPSSPLSCTSSQFSSTFIRSTTLAKSSRPGHVLQTCSSSNSSTTLALTQFRPDFANFRAVQFQNAAHIGEYFASASSPSSINKTCINTPPASILISSNHDYEYNSPIINTQYTALDQPKQSSHVAVRSLTLPMSTAVASITTRDPSPRDSPGSPPELTDSKSSKSSSFHSCAEAHPSDLATFEDISLDEVAAIHNASKAIDSSTAAGHFYRHAPQPSKAARDLTNSVSRSVSSLTTASNTAPAGRSGKYQLPVPGPRTSRIKQRQMSQPAINIQPQPQIRSRSPSPASIVRTLRTFSPSSTSLPTSHSSGGRSASFTSSAFNQKRRQNLQPRKKSVQELEKEFDELDDELPDDAVIINVPISPRPAHERGYSSASTVILDATPLPGTILSPNSSHGFSGQSSPERRSPGHQWTNNSISPVFAEPSPLSPGFSDASAEFGRPVSATKSREAVYGDLNREARELTQALELYAEESELQYERDVQSGKISRNKTASSPVSTVPTNLPPLRKSDPLIDPLPVSREKEQFLTRTRPSWLPPKSQKEEKRHLKEYQKLMARAAEAERKSAQRAHKLQVERDNAAEERAKLWETHVMQRWDIAVLEPRTKDLWWKGLPSQNRGAIWRRAVGNQLGLSAESFNAILGRVRDAEVKLSSLTEDAKLRDTTGYIFVGLQEDAATVFPELSLFQEGGPLHISLLDVCKAFALYRSNINWDYGIMTLVALLLINMQPVDAFITIANIFNRPLPSAILTQEISILKTTYNTILAMTAFKRPQLHTHLITLQNIATEVDPATGEMMITSPISPTPNTPHNSSLPPRPRSPTPAPGPLLDPAVYLFPILHGLCTATPRLSIEAVSRIWDVIVFEGDVALVRAAVSVIGKLESRLYCQPLEILDELDGPSWHIGEVEAFMQYMRSMEHMTDDS